MLALLVIAVAPLLAHGQSMNPGCLLWNCPKQTARAMVDPTFLHLTLCENGCTAVYKEDTTPGKLQYQNCTTKCALTYESEAGDEFLKCAMDHFCVGFPPIPGSCPYTKEHVLPSSSLASLSGEFWQQRGRNQLWDCYPCQHIHSMFLSNDGDFCAQTSIPGKGPLKAPCWSYTYSYDLYLTDDSTKTYGQTWQLPGDLPKGQPIDIYYSYQGTMHNETWYIMQEAKNYAIVSFCSYMFNWVNVGSIVWVRPDHELTEPEDAEIRSLYKEKLGIDYDSFCHTTHGQQHCRDPTAASRPLGARRPMLTQEQVKELKAALEPAMVTI